MLRECPLQTEMVGSGQIFKYVEGVFALPASKSVAPARELLITQEKSMLGEEINSIKPRRVR